MRPMPRLSFCAAYRCKMPRLDISGLTARARASVLKPASLNCRNVAATVSGFRMVPSTSTLTRRCTASAIAFSTNGLNRGRCRGRAFVVAPLQAFVVGQIGAKIIPMIFTIPPLAANSRAAWFCIRVFPDPGWPPKTIGRLLDALRAPEQAGRNAGFVNFLEGVRGEAMPFGVAIHAAS